MALTDEEIVQELVLITARKSDYLHELLSAIFRRDGRYLTSDRRSLHADLVRAVAAMDPRLFVSPAEVHQKRLDARTTLEMLDREALAGALARLMSPG